MRKGFTLIEILLALAIIGLVVAVALPNLLHVNDRAKEAEVKQNLHAIQLACERYAVDDPASNYPAYLVGGSANRSRTITPGADAKFGDVQSAESYRKENGEEQNLAADPLVREAYMPRYPSNPFSGNGLALHQLQQHLGASTPDPARNGAVGPNYGTRFGADCRQMGNIMADPRYRKWDSKTGKAGLSGNLPTYADVEYRCWDKWISKKPTPYLPGQFCYKSAGPLVSLHTPQKAQNLLAKNSRTSPVLPINIDQYFLAAYGSVRTKGMDMLGDERPIWSDTQANDLLAWTRSTLKAGLAGSPYSPSSPADGVHPVRAGNPNGVADGLVIQLGWGLNFELGSGHK